MTTGPGSYRRFRLTMSTIAALLLVVFSSCTSGDPSSSDQASFDRESLVAAQQQLLSRFDLKPYDASRDPLPRTPSFDELFEPIGLLEFSDSMLFNELRNVKVTNQGELIATDWDAGLGYLFRPDGSLKTQLNPAACSPGFQGTPRNVELREDGGIVIMYGGSPLSFAFSPEGNCVGPIDVGGWNPQSITVNDGRLFGYKIGREEWTVWEMIDSTKHELFSGTEFARMNNGYLSVTGDMFALDDSTLGLIFRHSPFVFRLSLSDGSITTMGEVPVDFVETEEDIPPGAQTQDQINDARRLIWEGKSRTWGYYRLAEDVLIVYHTNRTGEPFASSERSLGMRVMDLQGHSLHAEHIVMKGYMTQFIAARDGLFFRLLPEYRDEEVRLQRNPPVLVYRFKPPTSTS